MKNVIMLVLGIILCVVANSMRIATKTWIEQEKQIMSVPGNKGATTAVGATVGATAGAVTGAAIGGIGVAACGTGIGIPVGIVCLGLAAILGGAGATVGYAAGQESQMVETLVDVSKTGPVFSIWMWVLVLGIGIILIVGSIFSMWIKYRKEDVQPTC